MFDVHAPTPDDPIALRKYAEALRAAITLERDSRDQELAARDAEIYEKTLYIEKLKAQLAELRRARFGRSSEQISRDVEQLELALGRSGEGAGTARAISKRTTHESGPGRYRDDSARSGQSQATAGTSAARAGRA